MGIALIKNLSKKMTKEFGKGFTVANLKNMRKFYLIFQKISLDSLQIAYESRK
jgi:probable cytoplasmic protein